MTILTYFQVKRRAKVQLLYNASDDKKNSTPTPTPIPLTHLIHCIFAISLSLSLDAISIIYFKYVLQFFVFECCKLI